MNKNILILSFLAFICTSCATNKNSEKIIVKGIVSCDFTLANLSVKYIETGCRLILIGK